MAEPAGSSIHAPTGTKRCGCGIDIHAHIVPGHFPSYLGNKVPAAWPSMADAPPQRGLCHRHVMIAGKTYRTVSEQCWSVPRRLSDLAGMGLRHQAISPMPELLSYWMDAADAQPLLRFLNEQIAEMCAASEGVLLGLGAVPLQDVDLAVEELRYVIETLGFAGVEIGSNINGVPIGDPRFLPFFEACVALDAAVLVHAIKPAGMDRLIGPPPLQQVLAYPTDVGLAAASVMTGGLLQRLPALRLAFSHGGGTLATLLPRLQQGWQVFPALRDSIPESPLAQARRLFYDTLVFDEDMLAHLVARFGSSQLMLGTDYPFNFHDRTPLDRLARAGLDTTTAEQMTAGNARRFLARAFAASS
ncbi:amidohydrolase family protein [Pigmentiphaga litoralis]|uniref:amidohydrolase family protein n=1 Tax=Pigmentiphaga litoralis TaxID=516702 RepID=UPI003B433803